MNKFTILIICTFLVTSVFAQKPQNDIYSKTNDELALLFTLSYGLQKPGGDLADRFDNNSNIGFNSEVILKKSNWIFGVDGYFLFGRQVNEDVLLPIRDAFDGIIGSNQTFADVSLRQRGWYGGAHIGKLIGFSDYNRRMGIRASVGGGYFQHKVRIQDNGNTAPQFFDGNDKLYDHLTGGWALTQFLGFQVLAKNRLFNMYLGVELTEAWTTNQRSYNFVSMGPDDRRRMDLLYGVRLGWTLPLYIGENADEIYY